MTESYAVKITYGNGNTVTKVAKAVSINNAWMKVIEKELGTDTHIKAIEISLALESY